MPPRFVYWTILAGGLPTAFRAADREELLPTFKRILDKHPDAELKYFARGRLWASVEESRAAVRPQPEPRGKDWRPGGDHRDPRQKFADAKKERNQRWRKAKHERRERFESSNRTPRERPHGDPVGERALKAPSSARRPPAARTKPRPFRRTGSDGASKNRRRS